MIFGIGSDVVKIARIVHLYDNYGQKFLMKILSEAEQKIFSGFSLKSRRMSYLAKRFAAKEALVKALGTGFREDITFTSISIYNNHLGRPEISYDHNIASRLPENAKVMLSLSDEDDVVVAFAIIEVM